MTESHNENLEDTEAINYWQNKYCENGYITKSSLWFQCDFHQNSRDILLRTRKKSNFLIHLAERIMIELFIISNLKLPYKAMVTNTVENRHIHQWNIVEATTINPHGYCHPFFSKGIKTHSVKTKVASSNWCSGNWLSTCSVQNTESRPLSPCCTKSS